MSYESYNCIDAGSEYCPCHLAETGDCILCSQLAGKDFCDCANWNGVCIYQEYYANDHKAKEGRKYYDCEILKKEKREDQVLLFTIEVSDKMASDLVHPGSFVFVRRPDTDHSYDIPISIMDSDTKKNQLVLAIEMKGVKTKALDVLKEKDKLRVKAPFWNGILGLKNIYDSRNGTAIIVARGIGQAPMITPLKKLHANGNKVILILDNTPYKQNFIAPYLEQYVAKVIECTTIVKGELTEEFKKILAEILLKEEVQLVHCDGADILNYKVMKEVEKLNPKVKYACCNNAKMACGEGVCGCCTRKNNDRKLRRLCKMQTDPKYVLEGRRLF